MDPAEERRDEQEVWERVGRAAEDFARRVARDAGRFAERLQEHSNDLAGDLSREWRRGRRRHHHRHRAHDCRTTPQGDVRRVFEDVRGLVADVLDGIDDLITTVFQRPGAAAEPSWEKIVSNRDVACAACGRAVRVGEEVYASRHDARVEYRCLACGAEAPPRAEASAAPGSASRDEG